MTVVATPTKTTRSTKRSQPSTTNSNSMEQPKTETKVTEEQVLHLSDKAIKDYKLVRKAVEEGDQKAYAELMSR